MPGTHWYIAGLALLLAGPLALWLTLRIGSLLDARTGERFEAPGAAAVHVVEPGTYAVWLIEGEGDEPAPPDNIRITIIESTRGVEHELEPSFGAPQRVGSAVRTEMARATIERSGPYEIEISGDFPRTTFAFGPSSETGPAGGGLASSRLTGSSGAFSFGAALVGAMGAIVSAVGALVILLVWLSRRRACRAQSQV